MRLPENQTEETAYREQVWKENPGAIRIVFARGAGGFSTGYEVLKTVSEPTRVKVKPNYVPRKEPPMEDVGPTEPLGDSEGLPG